MEIDVIIVYIRESVYKNNRNVIFSVREDIIYGLCKITACKALFKEYFDFNSGSIPKFV